MTRKPNRPSVAGTARRAKTDQLGSGSGPSNSPSEASEQVLFNLLRCSQPLSEQGLLGRLRKHGVSRQEFLKEADLSSEADREWFERHPGIDRYVRPMSLDETMSGWAPPGWIVISGMTEVVQTASGIRWRRPVFSDIRGLGGPPVRRIEWSK
jgi:hypothetical protein